MTSTRRGQEGFTLIELIVATTVLGIIFVALTEAVLLGLRTTDATAAKESSSNAIELASSYFSADAQSALEASTTDPDCAGDAGVFLHLSWNDESASPPVPRSVSYAMDPATGGERDLIRWSCSGGGRDRQILGHFSGSATDPSYSPVTASCLPIACGPTASAPAVITLVFDSGAGAAPMQLSVHPRTG